MSEYKAKAKTVIKEATRTGLNIDSDSIYREIGVKRNVLVRKFPQVTKCITGLLEKHWQQRHQQKVEEYVLVAKDAIASLEKDGLKITVGDVAAELGLSVAGVSRYPQIIEMINEAK